MKELWILGATGRSGRATAGKLAAAKLAGADFAPVLVGRDSERLHAIASSIGGIPRVIIAKSVDAMITEISQNKPAVVINTIGPFIETALPIAKACLPHSHYIDISNELPSFLSLLALHEEAIACGRTIVVGSGYGVLGTESVVVKLCEGQPAARRVRVDALPYVEPEPGPFGHALASSIMGAMAYGGRRYNNGRLERVMPCSDLQTLDLPDGTRVKTAAGPTGDLEAARRSSNASFGVAASSMVPTGTLIRGLLPMIVIAARIRAIRNFATRRIAAIEIKPKAPGEVRTHRYSWTHARVEWESGRIREGWLRLGDASTFTTNAMVEVASRLARDEGRPGAYTPAALFGSDLAIAAGGEFIFDQ